MFVALGELEEISETIYHQVEDALLAVANGEDELRVAAPRGVAWLFSRLEVGTLIESSFHRSDSAWQASALIAMDVPRMNAGNPR